MPFNKLHLFKLAEIRCIFKLNTRKLHVTAQQNFCPAYTGKKHKMYLKKDKNH